MRDIDWIEIKTGDDIGRLMAVFGDYHNGCIKEMRYVSGNSEMVWICFESARWRLADGYIGSKIIFDY